MNTVTEKVVNLKDRADLLKALASSRRLAILSLIAGREGITTSEVKDSLEMSQGNTAFHLRRLHQAGIVEKSKDGRRIIYETNENMLDEKGINLGKLINAPMD